MTSPPWRAQARGGRGARSPWPLALALTALGGAAAAGAPLSPEELFREVSGSVYVVLAVDDAELQAMLAPAAPPAAVPSPGVAPDAAPSPAVPPDAGADRNADADFRDRDAGPEIRAPKRRPPQAATPQPAKPPEARPGDAPPPDAPKSPAARAAAARKARAVSLGSAVALTPEIAVTNCHVVAKHQTVILLEGKQGGPAEVVSALPGVDICLLRSLKLRLKPVKSVRLASQVSVGERAYAIGTPRGLERTLSEGLISAQRKNGATRVLQTTAPISPGSSGGGLFDAQGNLIGITTYHSKADAQLNFAVATDEFWPLSAQVTAPSAAAANRATKPPAPSGQQAPARQAPNQQAMAAAPPPPLQLQPDALSKCGPIDVQGLPFVTTTFKCREEEERQFGAEPAVVTRMTGNFGRALVDVSYTRLTSDKTWSPLSTVALRRAVEKWAVNSTPSNLSSFEANPFPHYKLNIVAQGKPFACARGNQRGGTGDKVVVWITYCEFGAHTVTPENLATVARALQFR